MPPKPATPGSSAGRMTMVWMVGLALLTAVLVGAVFALGGRLEEATWGLVVAAGALVLALSSLYRMAIALARPPVEVEIDRADVASVASVRALREERRRVLRAINELQFDYEMGKLSDEDYQKVREGYELRAVEVMRALDSESKLHPALAEVLRERGLLDEDEQGLAEKIADDADAADEMVADEREATDKPQAPDKEKATDKAPATNEADAADESEAADKAQAAGDAEVSADPPTSTDDVEEASA